MFQSDNSRDQVAGKTGSGRSDTTTSSLEPILWRSPIMSRSSLTDLGGHSVVHRLGDSQWRRPKLVERNTTTSMKHRDRDSRSRC